MIADIGPLAHGVASDEGGDVDFSHEGAVDEKKTVVQGVERLLKARIDAQARCRQVVVQPLVRATEVGAAPVSKVKMRILS